MRYSIRRIFTVAVLMGLLTGLGSPARADIPQTGCCKRDGLDPKVEAAIEEFRASVPGPREGWVSVRHRVEVL